MSLTPRQQLWAGLALAALMAMTRGHHFDSINLPSASWAVFFLAGILLQPRWVFPALFLEASLLDLVAINFQGVSAWCMSPAYWLLVPAYGSLWMGGRLYASYHREQLSSLAALAGCMVSSAFVCYLFSGGGFLFFSGRYPEADLAQLGQRIIAYYPGYLMTLSGYVAAAALVWAALRYPHWVEART